METKPLDAIDRKTRTINSSQWRMFCGNPSDERWAKFRSIVGVRARTLTPYEALMLWALRQWRVICRDMGIPFRIEEDLLVLERRVNEWLARNVEAQGMTAIEQIATLNNVEGRNFPTLIKLLLGKSVSEKSLYRLGGTPGMPKFSLNQRYSKTQVQMYLSAIGSN
jgi:hypothetical protein